MVKVKHRYILVESAEELGEEVLKGRLNGELSRAIGDIDYHRVNPRLMKYGGKRFVLRCSLDGYGKLVVALSMVKELDGRKVAFYTIKSSGTMRALLS